MEVVSWFYSNPNLASRKSRIYEKEGLLFREDRLVDWKVRKYYITTLHGSEVLEEARKKTYELFKEI